MYITYEQYKELGGKADESTFSYLVIEAGLKLDYYTSNRVESFLAKLTEVPKEIQVVMTKLIDMLFNSDSGQDNAKGLSSYSNGIETFSYRNANDTADLNRITITNWISQYLSKYPELIYRGVTQ